MAPLNPMSDTGTRRRHHPREQDEQRFAAISEQPTEAIVKLYRRYASLDGARPEVEPCDVFGSIDPNSNAARQDHLQGNQYA